MIQLKHIAMAAAAGSAVIAAPTIGSAANNAAEHFTVQSLQNEHCNPAYGKYIDTVRHGGKSYEIHCG